MPQNRLKPLPGVQWHVDFDTHRDLKRTRSDAVTSGLPSQDYRDGDYGPRLRSRSGDSITTLTNGLSISREHLHKIKITSGGSGDRETAVKTNGEATGNGGATGPNDNEDIVRGKSELPSVENGIGEKNASDNHAVHFRLPNSTSDDEDVFELSANYQGIGRSKFYAPIKSSQRPISRNKFHRRSRSLEDLTLSAAENGGSLSAAKSRAHIGSDDFCILTYSEPDELNTGGDYVMFETDGDFEFSGGEDDDGGAGGSASMEVKDLTPIDSSCRVGEELMREVGRKRSASANPPKATQPLLAVFQHRLDSIIVNIVTYPPGLSFVR